MRILGKVNDKMTSRGGYMEYLIIPLTALLSLIVLFIISKLLGNRTIASMSMYDYINSIAIGSIAAQLSIATGKKIIYNLIAMVVYGLFTYLCCIGTDKIKKIRNFLVGHPIVLMEKGKIYKKNFSKAHLDMDEFLTMLRPMGYFDLSKVDTAIFETNGQLSVIPISDEKPVTAMDLNLHPKQDAIVANVMMDGKVLVDNLKRMGKDETWLTKQIAKYKIARIEDIFLATLDQENTINFYVKVVPPDKNIL